MSSSRRVGSLAGLLPHTGLVPPLATARDAGADAGRLRAVAAAAAAAAAAVAAVGGASPHAYRGPGLAAEGIEAARARLTGTSCREM